MKYFYDLFAGIGGFRLGLERAGFKCVGSCEIDKYSREVYKKNFGDYPTERDVRELVPSKLQHFDILTAGFPCQSFSVAGNEKGFNDDRGNLFFEIIKITKEKKPSILLLENVKGLLSNDNGRTFLRILIELDAIGYDIQWQIINGKYYRPQYRERIFIIGYNREKPTRKIFPVKIYNRSNKETTKHKIIFTAHTKGNIKKRVQLRRYTWTLDTSGSKQLLIDNDNDLIRKLTPLECERLMGFPDDWTKWQNDVQRYKMLGNAVIPQIVEMIGRYLRKT